MAKDIIESHLPPKDRLTGWLNRLYKHRLTTTTGGNLSFIDDDGVMYITPSGGDKAEVPASNIASCQPGSEVFEGVKAPSMEWQLHKTVYLERPDCRAVLHAHSMALIAFSLGVKESILNHCVTYNHQGVPDTRCLFSAYMTCGQIGFCPYFAPGSDKLAAACAKILSQVDCVVMQNHGVVTIGSSLHEAYDRFVTLENLAQSIINALPLGIPFPLKENILEIKQQRNTEYQKYLCLVPQCTHAGCTSICTSHIMTGREKEARTYLCRFVKRAYEHNIFTSSSGSISLRCPFSTDTIGSGEVSFLITPTNVDRQLIQPCHLCFVSSINCKQNYMKGQDDTNKIAQALHQQTKAHHHPTLNNVLPSHSSNIHETIYTMHPEVNSIIIAQPPYATSFCITGKELNAAGIPESHLVLGDVKTLPFECLENGGLSLSNVLDLSKGISTVLVGGFGLVTVATTPLNAYINIEVCESICGVILTAMRRGTPTLLSNEQVQEIDCIFKKKNNEH